MSHNSFGHLFRIRYGMVSTDEGGAASNVAIAFTLTGGWTKPDYEIMHHLEIADILSRDFAVKV